MPCVSRGIFLHIRADKIEKYKKIVGNEKEIDRRISIVYSNLVRVSANWQERQGVAMYTTTELFDLEHTMAKDYLGAYEYPW